MKKLTFLLFIVLFFTCFVITGKDTAKENKDKKDKNKDNKILKHYIVVTATRTEQPRVELGSSTSIITAEELKKTGKTTVMEALNNIQGLDVIQYGGAGKISSIFIRGANSEQTLVMIDGVEMNDPMSPSHSFDFAHLTLDNIDHIEVVRGPQSTLYGSDAIGGVIQIITKKGKGKPKISFSSETGSYDTFKETFGLYGGTESINYSLGISRFDTKGFSASHKKYGNTERDGYGNTSMSARFGLTPFKNLNIDLITRYIDTKSDMDLMGGEGGDDPNSIFRSKQVYLRTQANISLFKGKWEQKLSLSLSNHERDYQDEKDSKHPFSSSESSFNGRMQKIEWQHNLYLHNTNTLTIGFEYEQEEGESKFNWESEWGPGKGIFPKKSASTTGFYFQDGIKLWKSFFATIGVRIDHHSRFGSVTTYRIAPTYIFRTGTKIKATYGTGFKAPSLYQLYAPTTVWYPIGNKDLSPEKCKSWDMGVEQYLFFDNLIMGLTYFQNNFKDLIQFDLTLGYINVTNAESRGLELFISSTPFKNLTLNGNYTYTKTKNKETGNELLRRPNHKWNIYLNFQPVKKINLNLNVIHVGRRYDIFPPPERIKTEAYTLTNVVATYKMNKKIQLFFHIHNLLDKDYEAVKGYGTAGRSLYIGFKATI